MTLQYLESLDSVRSTADEGAPDEPTLTDLQAFLESIIALALGRDIVVPQSYAFDSLSFLRVAELVLAARNEAGSVTDDRPFRLHLFGEGIETFDDAIADMLRRVHSPARPFHSSAHPRLSRLGEDRLAAMADNFRGFYGQFPREVGHRVRMVREEFELADAPLQVDSARVPRLDAVVAAFVDPSSEISRRTPRFEEESPGTYETLRSALSRLHAESPASFTHRSRLRQGASWDGRGGSTALQVLEDDESVLALVTEFLDTLYNRVVASSMGRVAGTFTTTPTVGQDAVGARLVAQNLAFTGPVAMAPENADEDEDPPAFDLVRVGQVSAAPDMAEDIRELMRRGSTALEELFRARADGGAKAGGNTFWRGIAALERTARSPDRRASADALDAHLSSVAALLHDRAQLRWTEQGRVRLVLTGASGGLPGLYSGSPLVSGLVAGVGAVVGAAVPEVSNGIHHRRRRKRLATALGTFVTIAPDDGPD
jgi:hypothetical protein